MIFIALRVVIFFSFIAEEVISEEVILKWYRDGHTVKGKMMFLEQMKKFVEWLQNAEEGRFPFNKKTMFKSSYRNFIYVYIFSFLESESDEEED